MIFCSAKSLSFVAYTTDTTPILSFSAHCIFPHNIIFKADMIMTYDFILTAKHGKNFRSKIDESILSNTSSEICTDIHRLTFFPESQTVTITA